MASEKKWVPVAAPVIGEREIECVTDAVRSGWVSSIGPYLDRFEHAFGAFCGSGHAVAVSNGTVALHLALRALAIGAGDEVVLPDLTFAATAHAVLEAGATPVFADVDPKTWCLDPKAVARALSERTRAIIPVHLYGNPADMPALDALAEPKNIVLVEDAAEAHGAEIAGKRVGSMGKAATFSFYGNKLMTTGEGGMVTTDDDVLAHRLRFLKDHGMSKDRRYYHTELAFNYRMTNLQAALGVAQLEQIEGFIQKKRDIMQWYREDLGDIGDIELNQEQPGTKSVFWMICLVLESGAKHARDEVANALRQRGVDTRPFFVPMSTLPHLAKFRSVGATGDGCPVSAELSMRGLNLPSGCSLTREDVRFVTDAVRAVLA